MSRLAIDKNVGAYVERVSSNNFFKGALLVLGVAFTASTVINNYYSIRSHRENLRAQQEKKNGNNKQ